MNQQSVTSEKAPSRRPSVRTPLIIGLRYLLRKKLSYLAVLGIALSVGVIIVVMSVFTGWHRQFTAVIRGYLCDMKVVANDGMCGVDDWKTWREKALKVEHVEGAAPFIQGAGLLRRPDTGGMMHVMFRGVDPKLEGTVSRLPEYMASGTLEDLRRTYPNPEGGQLSTCFLGYEFYGYVPPDLQQNPRQVVIVTATQDLRKRLAKYAVAGIFKTGNAQYDIQFVIMGLDAADDLVDSDGAVTGLNIRLDDYDNAEAARQGLQHVLRPGAVLRSFGECGPRAQFVALSRAGQWIAAALEGGAVTVWDAERGERLRTIEAGGAAPSCIALGPEGKLLLIGRADGSAAASEIASGQRRFEVPASGQAVTAARFSPYGYLAAVGRADGSLEVWDVDRKERLAQIRAHSGAINDLKFDSDGEYLASAGQDGVVKVWEAESGAAHSQLGGILQSSFSAVAFSPTGKLIAAGAADGHITIWRAKTRAPAVTWKSVDGPVLAMRFGSSSEALFVASAQGLRCYHIEPDAEHLNVWERRPAPITTSLSKASLRQRGTRVAVVDTEGRLRLHYSGPGFKITTWEEECKIFLEAMEMERFLQGLIMSLILVLAEFFVFAIITTMVYEKRHDIGILKAVGFTRGQIATVFMVCGLSIGITGALLGVGGGVLFAHNVNAVRELIRQVIHWDPFPPNVYYFTKVPSYVGVLSPALTAGGAILCSLLFSLVPALRAARMDPVETLHYE